MQNRDIIEKDRLILLLLESITSSRYRIIRENWENRYYGNAQKRLGRQMTVIREELFNILTSRRFRGSISVIEEILLMDESRLLKCTMILHILGLRTETIADMLCINKGFCTILISQLPEKYPHIYESV